MAAFSPTAANVSTSRPNQATAEDVICGETLVAGDIVYKDTSDSNHVKKTDNSVLAKSIVAGVMLTGGADGQPGKMQKSGDLNMGGTLVVGETYVLSSTTGAMEPVADLLSNDYVSIVGVATSASNLHLILYSSQVQVP